MVKKMNDVNKKMSLLEKMSYGSGNMGICLCTTIVTTFIMYFYTNVVKIGVLQVGTIMFIGGIADAISDALMGIIVDHTNTRWGKCRPYLIFGAIPMAIACFFMFHVPNASATVKYIYALITYIIFTLAYTAVLIPQNVLISAITDDTEDRLATNMFGSLGTNIGQLITGAFALSLVAILGHGSEYRGYNLTILLFGAFGALLTMVDGFNTRERMNMGSVAQQKISLSDTIKSLKNGPWVICALTALFIIAQVVVKSSTTVFYANNVLHNPKIASTLLSIANIIGIPITLVIPFVAAKIGNRNIVWVGAICGILGNVGMYFFKFNMIATIAFAVIASVGTAFINGIIYVMCAESIDYGEWKHGIRVQGFLMAFIGFAIKIANSIVQMLTTVILNAGGYSGAAKTQPLSAIHAIEFCYIWIPVILLVAVFIMNGFYKLDKIYPQIRQDLEEKRTSASQQA